MLSAWVTRGDAQNFLQEHEKETQQSIHCSLCILNQGLCGRDTSINAHKGTCSQVATETRWDGKTLYRSFPENHLSPFLPDDYFLEKDTKNAVVANVSEEMSTISNTHLTITLGNLL